MLIFDKEKDLMFLTEKIIGIKEFWVVARYPNMFVKHFEILLENILICAAKYPYLLDNHYS